ncbi:MAG TPA: glycosyltransferase [Rickettsiales bacterium]|nr:glycosyltransferase [Rickettsiales bacterium]
MAQLTAMQAALCADDVTLYAPADSDIINYTKDIADALKLQSEISRDYSTIRIQNQNGSWGTVTLRTTGENATRDLEANTKLLDLLIADEHEHPSDVVHLHDRKRADYLAAGGLQNVILHEHTAHTRTSSGTQEKKYPYPIIALSQDHADNILHKMPDVDILGVAHHGLFAENWPATDQSAGYLLSIGRFAEYKGTHRAIEIAQRSRKTLIIAGTTKYGKQEYFDEKVQPHIDIYDETLPERIADKKPEEVEKIIKAIEDKFYSEHPGRAKPPVIFVGEVNDAQKKRLYANADATLMPLSWREPFGLIMIESMASGTPVIGFSRLGDIRVGAVEEIVDEGVTGFKISADTEEEAITRAVEAVHSIGQLARTRIREVFDRKWSAEHEVRTIQKLFNQYIHQSQDKPGTPQPAIYIEVPGQIQHER